MQTANRKGRVNYEPNGWAEGPRAHPLEGYVSYSASVSGDKARLRPESFADHYSQARQFFISQTSSEQRLILSALVFELSKCEQEPIRIRMVAHLMHTDKELAQDAADRLGIAQMPEPAPTTQPSRMDLKPSPSLSIQSNPPDSSKGRIMGVLISDGFDGALLAAQEAAVSEAGGVVRIIAPKIGGASCTNNNLHSATDQLGGAPSVLFDAVTLMPGANSLATVPAAIEFLQDACVHCKHIGLTRGAEGLVAACGLSDSAVPGLHALTGKRSSKDFVAACRGLRVWGREATFMS